MLNVRYKTGEGIGGFDAKEAQDKGSAMQLETRVLAVEASGEFSWKPRIASRRGSCWWKGHSIRPFSRACLLHLGFSPCVSPFSAICLRFAKCSNPPFGVLLPFRGKCYRAGRYNIFCHFARKCSRVKREYLLSVFDAS